MDRLPGFTAEAALDAQAFRQTLPPRATCRIAELLLLSGRWIRLN